MTMPAADARLPDALVVTHNPAANRFEAWSDGKLCRADYRRTGDTLHIYHTEVPWELQGRGLAAQVMAGVVAYAAANGLKIVPLCSYVRTYMNRHPESHAVLAR